MPSEIRAPILSDKEIRRCADGFLATYHPSLALPIPIEEIIDLRLQINIIPVPGLQVAFEIDAFTSSDCTEINVDEFVYSRRPNRYRFSLAHELGHILLHRQIYRSASFQTIAGWISFVRTCPADQYDWLEWQAYCFGGLVLVPRDRLEAEAELAVGQAKNAGVSISPTDMAAWEHIADFLARRFEVSREAMMKRLQKERIPTVRWLRSKHLL